MFVLFKDKDTLFSLSMLTPNVLLCEQAGSNFRATYVVDWDKDNYFSILNVRRRKFEKERLEQQERMEAERAQKEEARQAELALAEEERQKVEQAAAALRLVLLHSTVKWHDTLQMDRNWKVSVLSIMI